MSKEQAGNVNAMVNLDTLGLTTTKVWNHRSDKNLVKALMSIANTLKLPLQGMNVEQVGDSDASSFAARKIPAITIHSYTQEAFDAGILHSPKDQISAIKMDDYYQSYCLLAAYLSYLDVVPLRSAGAASSR
jgi:putative aminopeptidase FrvX